MNNLVTGQIGQWGNQVGAELFAMLSVDKSDTFFKTTPNNTRIARAVLLDMEPKVIHQTIEKAKSSKQFQYNKNNQYYKQSGSANNWAFGYASHGPSCKDTVLDLIRREVESCDSFGGFLVMQSLAGGTGSGLGAFFTEQLRLEFPDCFMVNQVVWPYDSGEVIVQNYNSLLSLATLYEVCSFFL